VFEIVNMLPPPELQAQRAPPSAPRAPCAVTGLPAKYRYAWWSFFSLVH